MAWPRGMTADRTYVPSEGAEQAELWVGWPHLQAEWGDTFDGARVEIADFVQAASRFVPVVVACGSDAAEASAAAAIGGDRAACRLARVPTGDIWLRDTGPVMAEVNGAATALVFAFNGWGGKYVMPGDAETAGAMAAEVGAPVRAHDFVLEGGAIELDGAGRLLTTRQCLLNPNRNPRWDEAAAETALKTAFGVDDVIWLDHGLANDHTDGHVDNLARFIAPGHVLCQRGSGDDDPNAAVYVQIEQALRAAGLQVSTLPSPGLIGDAMPASHLNFTLTNGALVMPAYEGHYSAAAMIILAELFPRREVMALPARNILSGGGSFHCMTREIPRFPTGVA